jgi:hypothetical protein
VKASGGDGDSSKPPDAELSGSRLGISLTPFSQLAMQEGMLALAPASLVKVLRVVAGTSSAHAWMAQCRACHLDVWVTSDGGPMSRPCVHCKTVICHYYGLIMKG